MALWQTLFLAISKNRVAALSGSGWWADLRERGTSTPRTGWGLLNAAPREAICSYKCMFLERVRRD